MPRWWCASRKRAGYTVATARRVDRAAEFQVALGACAWSAVLCDYALPGFSPEEALAQVQASGSTCPSWSSRPR